MVKLLCDGLNEADLKKECLENNLFGSVNEYRAKRTYGYLINRIKMLDEDLAKIFLNSEVSTQKLINLICILRKDRLFFEFVYEVYREKAILGQKTLEDADFNAFFTNKGNQSEFVQNLTEATKKHLRSNYATCMADANLLRIEKRIRNITTPVINLELANYLENAGEKSLLTAIGGMA